VIRIALDAMGGDFAPEVPIQGALMALGEISAQCELLLVGPKAVVEAELAKQGGPKPNLRLVDAAEVVGMGEKPLEALKKKPNSSISVGLTLQKKGEADAFLSAGNTGACMAASTLILRLHPGVKRPAIGALFPTAGKPVLVMDVGANVDCDARELEGFAHLGSVYARDVLQRPKPKIGLLNIGEEDEKGNAVARETHQLLKQAEGLNFAGNVEGRDILSGVCDVVVCDGFTGNVLLKFYESVGKLFFKLLAKEVGKDAVQQPLMKSVAKVLDYSEYGGAPLLGVKGVSIICHGSSSDRAIKNAIKVAIQNVESQVSQHIGAEFAKRAASAPA
jgi:glycerol-3-phosphate acyltransferase PlsX